MRMEGAFNNICMYLYNKNILGYAQIARNETESKIPYIESHSSIYLIQTLPEFSHLSYNLFENTL